MAKKANILIFGAGKGGTLLLELIARKPSVNVIAVIDTNPDAPGIKLATKLGIPVGSDIEPFLKSADEIINVTGSQRMQEELIKCVAPGVEVIGGHSAKIMWELVEDRKLAEAQTVSIKAYAENLLKVMVDGLWVINLKGETLDCNPEMVKMMGYETKNEFMKNRPEDLTAKKDLKETERLIKESFEKGTSTGEITMIRKDGSEITASIKTSATRDAQGNVMGGFAVIRDITLRKKAEGVIQKTAREWQTTFDSAADLIFLIDKESVITRANKAFCDALKMKFGDIVGKKCYELVHKRNSPWPGCPFEMTAKDKKSHTGEVDDPKIGIPLLVTSSPIFDDKGELVGAVHFAKDISDIKKTEQEMERKIRDLEMFQKAATGRELKMIELKKRIAELELEIKRKK